MVAVIRRRMISFWETMTVERGRAPLARCARSGSRRCATGSGSELADGGTLTVHGNVLTRSTTSSTGAARAARISRKWFRVRDTYAVDVEQADADVPLLLSVAVCVDALTGDD